MLRQRLVVDVAQQTYIAARQAQRVRSYMLCLSVKNPWAYAIFRLGKDVENRTWVRSYRGKIGIHVSLTFDKGFYSSTELKKSKLALSDAQLARIDATRAMRGHVIGHVNVVDIVSNSKSAWACKGHFHWILENPVLYRKPIAATGKLGLWTL